MKTARVFDELDGRFCHRMWYGGVPGSMHLSFFFLYYVVLVRHRFMHTHLLIASLLASIPV